MPPGINHTNNSGASRWITIGLVAVVLASAAFVAWAVYATKYNHDAGNRLGAIYGGTTPVTPRFNCPLDGTPVANRAAANNRPIIVQVDNAPGARPQSGLSQADIVYEGMAEGDVTRFSAVFACHEADPVGPVRSARLIDLELGAQYQGLLADSGSSQGVTAALASHPEIPNISDPAFGQAVFNRDNSRIAPHNLMSSTGSIRAAAVSAGFPVTVALPSLTFKDDTPAPAITSIELPYSGIVDDLYTYDAGTNSWLRSIGGVPHTDAATGRQLAVKNVIIQYVTITQSGIEEDSGGNYGLEFTLTGSGRVQVFRDGQMIEGTWSRPAKDQLTTYLDSAGNPIPLNRGLTFVQLVAPDFQPKVL
ncbi:MAG: DUF3048 domain-containing protein [Thermoleophilia bacterium]